MRHFLLRKRCIYSQDNNYFILKKNKPVILPSLQKND